MLACIQLLTAQLLFWPAGAVFSNAHRKREKFGLRIFCLAVIVLVYSVILFFVYQNGGTAAEYIARLISALFMVGFIYSGWRVRRSVAVYNAIWAIMLWQLLYELATAIEFMFRDYFAQNVYAVIPLVLCLFGINYSMVALTIGRWMPAERKNTIGPRQMAAALVLFVIVEVLATSEELRHISEYSSEWKFLYISQLLCLVILYMQNEMFKKSELRQELAIMNLLWKNKQEQYELSKENIALINQKAHDLKHQIRALRKLNKEEFEKYLDEIEENVKIYESIVKTGNDVFDTILSEKSLYCQKHEIKVTCVADGSQMDFIDTIDLYAILGNTLDNAIEAVQKFSEPEKRQISVMIHRQQNFLVMNFINPIEQKIVFEGNLPVTTKGDKNFHGFGLRSVLHIVKKYDGYMHVSEEDGCFSLKIMIPIP